MEKQTIASLLHRLRESKPLVHTITNIVVANFTANGLLALEASPIMADAKEEVAEITSQADVLVLNLGTPNPTKLEAMVVAGKTANKHGIPVVLDPVGVGASSFRKTAANKILNSIDVQVIRGNSAEIACLNNLDWKARGVDSVATSDFGELAMVASKNLNCTVVITGREDIASNGVETYKIKNGHPLLTKVTGTGCLLSSTIGAFLCVSKEPLQASVSALVAYGVAAELAAMKTIEKGPGSFQVQLLNELALVSGSNIVERGIVEQVN